MEKSDLNKILMQFRKASARLEEALKESLGQNPLAMDGTIQRFEFCFELCWKTLKRFLEFKGVSAKSPRDVFQEAFKLGWLTEGDAFWYAMIEDRNQTSHAYDEQAAMDLYQRIPGYLQSFKRLRSVLEDMK